MEKVLESWYFKSIYFLEILNNVQKILIINQSLMRKQALEAKSTEESLLLLSAICSLIFLHSKGGKRQTLWKENTKPFVCFAKIFSVRTLRETARHPRCFEKKSVGLQNLMFRKCYFQT